MNMPQWPSAGDPTAQEFRIRDPWSTVARVNAKFVPLLVIFFFIMTALGSLPFGGKLLPGMVVGAVATVPLVLKIYLTARRGLLSTVVRMSPAGVEWWDGYGFHVRLPWQQVTRVDVVHTAMTKPGARVGVPGGVQLTVRPVRNSGLIGWGSQQIPDRAPQWVKGVLANVPRDPRTGAAEVAIPLSGIDAAWMTGAMGDWVRRFRPDLFSRT